MLNIIYGATNKSALIPSLTTGLEPLSLDGFLFIGYPVLGGVSSTIDIDALLISKQTGVIIVHLVEGGTDESTVIKSVMSTTNIVKSKLLAYPDLADWDDLKIPVRNITLAPIFSSHISEINQTRLGICRNPQEVSTTVQRLMSYDGELYETALSVIQTLTKLRQEKPRNYVKQTTSRGGKLRDLEGKISTLDVCQSQAVIETVNGVQRIRGLAGSGKTIVLARKIAYLHAKNPHWKIAITFNTRSLKSQFKRLISLFCLEQSGIEPDFERIKIIQAWGSTSSEGIYHNACLSNNSLYHDFNSAKNRFAAGKELEGCCKELLDSVKKFKPLYDLVLIDEAQDFSADFLRLAYEQLDENKRLVYAYDELQSLNDISMQSPSEIWGTNSAGKPNVTLDSLPGEPKKDIVLNVCYRNPKPILASAHALGFGVYRDSLIQMFDYAPLWEEIGYKSLAGEIREGKKAILTRTPETSPDFLHNHSPLDDLIQLNKFESEEAQAEWLVGEIEKNLNEDELRHSDIIVIHSDAKTTRSAVGYARELLMHKGIKSDIAGVTASPDVFSNDDAITFTSIFRAKGNEAAMVYVINAQQSADGWGLSTKRNILFTAMTRTKAWLRVCGVGNAMDKLIGEYESTKQNDFKLEFIYPTAEQRAEMRILNRDMSDLEKDQRVSAQSTAQILLASLQSGLLTTDDLDEETRNQLAALLNK